MEYRAFRSAVEQAARAAGLTAFELYYQKGSSQSLSAFRGEIDSFSLSEHLGVCFRCIVDGRAGYASTTLMSEEEAQSLVKAAVQSAKCLETTDPEYLVEQAVSLDATCPPVEADTADLKQAILDVEKKVLAADPRIQTIGGAKLMSGASERGIFNSYGVDLVDSQQYYAWYTIPVAVENGKTCNAIAFQIDRTFDKLNADTLAAEAVEYTLANLGAQRLQSGKYPTVFDALAFGDLLSAFATVFSAESAQKGMSLLKDREGEVVAAECVTLIDDPACEQAVFHSRFDDEGVMCSKKAVIENGCLQTLLYNLKTAAKAGRQSTGNAYKAGFAENVVVAPTNLYLQPGAQSLDELFEQVGDGIYVTDVSGLHAGAHAVTGDFSLEAKGFRIRDGKRAEAIELFTVAGNFFTLLQDIVAVGNDLRFGFPEWNGQIGAPSIYVREIAASGE